MYDDIDTGGLLALAAWIVVLGAVFAVLAWLFH